MVKNHLMHGKIIFPQKLKLKKNLKISIIGAGEIAYKYAEVINSFNHTIEAVLTSTNSKKNQLFIKKFNIENHYTDYEKFIQFIYKNKISAIIVCVSWNKSYEIFKKILTIKKPILFEKSIITKSSELQNIYDNYKVNNITFAFNRNYYDYFEYLVNFTKINKPKIIYSNLSDQFDRIIKKRGKQLKKNIHKYITIHWLSFLYAYLKKINVKIISKNKFKNIKVIKIGKYKVLTFEIKNNFFLIITITPDNPTNNKIEIISSEFNILIQPFEKLEIFDKLIVKNKNKIRTYNKRLYRKKIVDSEFKEGFRHMYYDFIKCEVLKEAKSSKSIKLNDLINIYKLCELI